MKIRKVFAVISTTVVILAAALVMLLAGMRLFGLQMFSVLSGSMEDSISVGGVVYVKEVEPVEIAVGDVITYRMGNAVVTHRVIELVPADDGSGVTLFRTKGDANNSADSTPVHPQNVIGKVVFDLPLLGYLATGLQTGAGKVLALLFGVLLAMLVLLPDMVFNAIEQSKLPVGQVPPKAPEGDAQVPKNDQDPPADA